MAAATDVVPPPPLEDLCKLQLMRYTLVKLIMEVRNFEEIITGCYARVLLEMRQNRAPGAGAGGSGDNYFIVKIKGVHKGPSYTGFSWDGVTTDYHILIEIPSCFRSTNPSNNYVQLNSISNSVFRQAEYDEWTRLHREAQCPFQSAAQLALRHQTLREHLDHIKLLNARQRGNDNMDPVLLQKLREKAYAQVDRENVCLPPVEQLNSLSSDELFNLQRRCHEMMETLRVTVYNRTRCRACDKNTSTLICYPCRHQVLCEDCREVSHCPAPGCGKFIQDKIKPYVESS